jgi:hypothetical protein
MWQPIETAPYARQPDYVLVWGPKTGIQIGRVYHYPEGDVSATAVGFTGEWGITHWQPLPEPPK